MFIDGFNLYYSLVRPSGVRLIDLKLLMGSVLDTRYQVDHIHYFTARVSNTIKDPNISTRQSIYLQALQEHIPNLSIYYGQFSRHLKKEILASTDRKFHPAGTRLRRNYKYTVINRVVSSFKSAMNAQIEVWPKVDIVKTEEKSSDVNLAIYMLGNV